VSTSAYILFYLRRGSEWMSRDLPAAVVVGDGGDRWHPSHGGGSSGAGRSAYGDDDDDDYAVGRGTSHSSAVGMLAAAAAVGSDGGGSSGGGGGYAGESKSPRDGGSDVTIAVITEDMVTDAMEDESELVMADDERRASAIGALRARFPKATIAPGVLHGPGSTA
jgi:hypothetical protein